MNTTSRFKLKLLSVNQAQKETTLNESINKVDAIMQSSAINISNMPPSTVTNGDVYVLDANPSGVWLGQAQNVIALYSANVWRFIAPIAGMRIWVKSLLSYLYFNSNAWVSYEAQSLDGSSGNVTINTSNAFIDSSQGDVQIKLDSKYIKSFEITIKSGSGNVTWSDSITWSIDSASSFASAGIYICRIIVIGGIMYGSRF